MLLPQTGKPESWNCMVMWTAGSSLKSNIHHTQILWLLAADGIYVKRGSIHSTSQVVHNTMLQVYDNVIYRSRSRLGGREGRL